MRCRLGLVIALTGSIAVSGAALAQQSPYAGDQTRAIKSLSAADVANGAGISERHLSRLFADSGTSIPEHILARRLDLAHALLCRPDARDLRVVDVAARCGFTSTAYFSETFKRRFGSTAGHLRRTATD